MAPQPGPQHRRKRNLRALPARQQRHRQRRRAIRRPGPRGQPCGPRCTAASKPRAATPPCASSSTPPPAGRPWRSTTSTFMSPWPPTEGLRPVVVVGTVPRQQQQFRGLRKRRHHRPQRLALRRHQHDFGRRRLLPGHRAEPERRANRLRLGVGPHRSARHGRRGHVCPVPGGQRHHRLRRRELQRPVQRGPFRTGCRAAWRPLAPIRPCASSSTRPPARPPWRSTTSTSTCRWPPTAALRPAPGRGRRTPGPAPSTPRSPVARRAPTAARSSRRSQHHRRRQRDLPGRRGEHECGTDRVRLGLGPDRGAGQRRVRDLPPVAGRDDDGGGATSAAWATVTPGRRPRPAPRPPAPTAWCGSSSTPRPTARRS